MVVMVVVVVMVIAATTRCCNDLSRDNYTCASFGSLCSEW